MYSGDLIPCDYQYQISFNDVCYFKIGQKVFLKSNPEVELTVESVDINKQNINVTWIGEDGLQNYDFKPWTLLPYKLASLVIYKNKFKFCLN